MNSEANRDNGITREGRDAEHLADKQIKEKELKTEAAQERRNEERGVAAVKVIGAEIGRMLGEEEIEDGEQEKQYINMKRKVERKEEWKAELKAERDRRLQVDQALEEKKAKLKVGHDTGLQADKIFEEWKKADMKRYKTERKKELGKKPDMENKSSSALGRGLNLKKRPEVRSKLTPERELLWRRCRSGNRGLDSKER